LIVETAAYPRLSFLVVVCALAFFALLPRANADDALTPPRLNWASTLRTGHPLVGKIWSPAAKNYVSPGEMVRGLSRASLVLLGEVHDNPDHHRWQGWLVAGIAKTRRAAGSAEAGRVAFEMVMADKADRLKAKPETAAAFAQAVEWDKSGWPPFAVYEPVVAAAIADGYDLVPASPTRELNRTVRKGFDGLDAETRTRLALAEPFAASLTDALSAEIKISHCNMMPDSAIGAMVNVQRYRDAVMADALVGGNGGDTNVAILIAGNGHVRRDRGVPWYLLARGRKADEIASVIHVEVEDGKTDPSAYVPRAPDGSPAADYVVFTPATARPDPCEKLKTMPEKPR
jgi:uncharacterized iron-regulated protein